MKTLSTVATSTEEDSANDPDQFTIDRTTGQITVRPGKSFNYEATPEKRTYSFLVTATDPSGSRGITGGKDVIRVNVNIEDVNEAPKVATGATAITHPELGHTPDAAGDATVLDAVTRRRR